MEWNQIRVRLKRWQAYQQLLSLCNDSKEFAIQAIQGPEQEDDLTACVIIDTRKRKRGTDKGPFTYYPPSSTITVPQEVAEKYEREGRLAELFLWGHPEERGVIIGTMRFLDEGNNTSIRFSRKDVCFHEEITNEGAAHFRKFEQICKDYFESVGLLVSKEMEPSKSENLDTMPPSTESSAAGQSDNEPADDIKQLIDAMRQHHKGSFNPVTAREVIKAIPKAAARFLDEGGRWGPGQFEPFCNVISATIGRYLKSLRAVQPKIGDITLPGPGIKIP